METQAAPLITLNAWQWAACCLARQFINDRREHHRRDHNGRRDRNLLRKRLYGDNAGSGMAFWHGGLGSPAVEVRLVEPAGTTEEYHAAELKQFRVARDYMMHHR